MDLNELDEFIVKVNSVSDAVSTVQANIEERRESFVRNERQTRSGLIDPILRILGWDVSQVDLVGSEYRTSSSGTADYALFGGSDPIALIEAKRLGKSLDVEIVEQLANYTSNENTVRFAIFTNGDHWRMREKGKRETVFDINLSVEQPLKSALEMMRLGRDVLLEDQDNQRTGEEKSRHVEQSGPTESRLDDTNKKSSVADWVSLDEVGFQTGDPRPKSVMLPDKDHPIDVGSYKDLWVEVVEWLFRNEKSDDWERYFFNRFASVSPPDPNSQPHPRQLSNGLWLATNYSTIYTGQNIKNALSSFGRDFRGIKVSFSKDHETHRHRLRFVGKPDTALPGPVHSSGSRSRRNDMDWYPVGDRTWSATHTKPKTVEILGNSHKVNEWADFSQLISTWLIETGRLERKDCPVSVTTSKRCLVNTVPAHPDGKPFFDHSRRQLPKGMWIETNQGANQHVQYAFRLLRKFGVDPNSVQIQIG